MKDKKLLMKTLLSSLLVFLFLNVHISGEAISLFSESDNQIVLSALFAGLYMLQYWFYRKAQSVKKANPAFLILELLLGVFFAGISLGAHFYRLEMSVQPAVLFAGRKSCFITILAICGGTLLYSTLIKGVRSFCFSCSSTEQSERTKGLYRLVSGAHTFWKSVLFILLCWLPQILIRYPGAMTTDSWKSIHHYWNPELWTNQHPILYTLLLGRFSDLGIAAGNIGQGLFVLIAAQIAIHILVMAYSVETMRRFRADSLLRVVTLVFYAVFPMFSALATTYIIDAGYCAAFLLLITELAIGLYDTRAFVRSIRHWILTVLAAAGMFLRYNGIYMMLIMGVSLFCFGMIQFLRKKEKLIVVLLLLLMIVLPTIFMQVWTTALTERYTAANVSGRAKNAMIIQQLARCVKEHPDSFSEGDRDILGAVMHIKPEQIAEKYNPYTFDSLKGYFNREASAEELRQFRRLWIRMVKEHPGTCINAVVHQNYFLFDLMAHNSRYYAGFTYQIKNKVLGWDYSDLYHQSETKTDVQRKLREYYYKFTNIPFAGLFTDQAIYTLILAAVSLITLLEGKRRNLVLLLPLLGTIGIVLIGPACYKHARYTYPLVYTLPLLLSVTVFSLRVKEQSS